MMNKNGEKNEELRFDKKNLESCKGVAFGGGFHDKSILGKRMC